MEFSFNKELERLDEIVNHCIEQMLDGNDNIMVRKKKVRIVEPDYSDDYRYNNPPLLAGNDEESGFHNAYHIAFYSTGNIKNDGYIDISPRYVMVEGCGSVKIPTCKVYDKYAQRLEQVNDFLQAAKLSKSLDHASKIIGYDRTYKLKNILES